MKYLASLALALAVVGATPVKRDNAQGVDVSDYQGSVDWQSLANNGYVFAYIKATEGTDYTSPSFSDQYTGATNAGFIRGGYHFARPDKGPGADQANFFLNNGGGWSADGITLPGAIDLEAYPNMDECYGLGTSDMVSWIADFSNTYYSATNRYPVIYTTTSWWSDCTGNDSSFGGTNALWIANWGSSPYPIPAGWADYTIWQYTNTGPVGDTDVWNGDYSAVQSFAYGN